MFIPGRNPTIEALRSDKTVHRVVLEDGINSDAKISDILEMASSQGIKVEYSPRKKLARLAENDHHQGVIAEVDLETTPFNKDVLESNPGFYIYIREAQYDHNLGAIIRTAEAAGIAGVILPPKQELTPTIVRISMGAALHIPIYQGSLFPTIKLFTKAGMQTTGIEINGAKNIYESDISGDGLLIVGGEDKSLSEEVVNKLDQVIFIPQAGKVNSLNMSVAAAIALYEHIRQRR